jgi:hypothetical protein
MTADRDLQTGTCRQPGAKHALVCLCRSAVETNLRQLAAENAALSVQPLPALGASTAAWQLSVAATRLLVVLTNGQLRLERYNQAAEQEQGKPWAAEAAGTISMQQLQEAIYGMCGATMG